MVPSVAIKWKALGEVLLHHDIVETGYLEITETNNPKDVVECCKQVFIKWLETDKDASWEQLITALQSSGVQFNFIAEQIKKNLQEGETIVPIGIIYRIAQILTVEIFDELAVRTSKILVNCISLICKQQSGRKL